MRDDPDAQQKVMEHFTAGNQQLLKENGFEPTATNSYIVHFAGRSGGISALKADDAAKLSSVLSADAMKANRKVRHNGKAFKDFTIADLKAWAASLVGGTDG